MQLEGTSTLVTGGASGLGFATAARLVERGAHVVLLDLESSPGPEAAEKLGERAAFAAADILDEDQVNGALDLAERHGPLRAVVHCAGRGGDRLRIVDRDGKPGDFDSFQNVVRINLFGTYNVLRLSAARMSANEHLGDDRGAIVLTASVAAFDGQIGQASYASSKAAVHGLTLVAARDLASRGIRVNTIAPGTFDTPMLARLRSDIRDQLAAAVPHPKRLGDPDDYAHLAVAMLENRYLNGDTVRLDGAIRMPPR
ncbi:SDR family NAD(P)-dependent oxidoreductase [Amycolatopsis rubida]|uniref:SDR family NAD(P)-dependent oxidoreductase n=1 Tax=Amycolatopsis rubida TaxID=112413 RepID=A0ABX0C827_9PSEU|nr:MULTISPECIES: SDR family NAD(P)-dependent oxidoreductase [Amycolatopsis]MYW96129.1 SDR family NAD(P)-dependent oxidoreductase [Amycolatopsis rubida]NEC61120.1 SDR family NAD(P)-dependent oxidoreductase [Amycolatopsis rubida]OAP23357.1 3-oxoacyl-[acyl-carrier-protein] reductase FabG [Amycolatopsis sp. M39]